MAVTIDATVGGASSNSYTTLAEFSTYMEARYNSDAFDSATTDNQNRVLVEATRWLTTLSWDGYRVDSSQALAWPRSWARDPDSPTAGYYDETVIPQRVKDATMELAFQFLVSGTTDAAALDSTVAVKRKRIDVIETEYDSYSRPVGLSRFPSVTRYIRPLLSSAFSGSFRVVKG